MNRILPPLFAVAVLAGCADQTAPLDSALYRVEAGGESFHVLLHDPALIAGVEARLADGTWEGIVNGELARSDGGFNAPWSWHLLPETVVIADFAIELCDGRPSMVEDDIDYWVDTVERFCPWGGRVVERVNSPRPPRPPILTVHLPAVGRATRRGSRHPPAGRGQ